MQSSKLKCQPVSSGKITCTKRGPFVAIDAACITSSPDPIDPINGAGLVIPFASGVVPVALTTVLGGLVSHPLSLDLVRTFLAQLFSERPSICQVCSTRSLQFHGQIP